MSVNPHYKPVIVIPAFQRADSLEKLLISLNQARYPANDHHVILSLEGNSSESVRTIAREFQFLHGTKEIIEHDKQLGLKAHIYYCAALTDRYGSVILLEDDLTVSPLYYQYSVHALQTYGESEEVAGISLYAQAFNETAQLPFIPMQTCDAAYFMQLASSWGVVWSTKQWDLYKAWRLKNLEASKEKLLEFLPLNIQKWPESSWKKEFNLYLAGEDKFLSYPYVSLTSNSSHYEGEHMSNTGSLFEVPLLAAGGNMDRPIFPREEEPFIYYDMYMEAAGKSLLNLTGYLPSETEMDLYGTKPVSLLKRRKQFITSKVPKNPIRSYPLYRLPIELNTDKQYPQTRDPFFYLCSSESEQSLGINRWGYAKLASVLGTNRISTKYFLKNSLLYFLRQKFNS